MSLQPDEEEVLSEPLVLPCGVVLKNRLAKAAMSDSLGDGTGHPTNEQVELYRRWSTGGAALSLIGEVQLDHRYAEKPGNLVLSASADDPLLRRLVEAGSTDGAHLWPQLGHAGALAHGPISRPAGPSALNLDGLQCEELPLAEVETLPERYARAAAQVQAAGFSGAEIHAGHGFLLSQFLSPLFNRRSDHYGGSIENRCRLLISIVQHVRAAAGPEFAIAVKINSSDQLDGGLTEDDALSAISMLGNAGVDLIEISGGTYFPGAPSSSDRRSSGPYFTEFARLVRDVTDTPLMVTGGFKTRREASDAVASGATDVVGLARTMALDPDVAAKWISPNGGDPEFPRFETPPPGGVTAWYTMRLTAIATGNDEAFELSLDDAISTYDVRDAARVPLWQREFS